MDLGHVFFQKHWTIVGNDVTNCISDFFQGGKMLKEINHTLIALISEVDNFTMTS